MTKALLNLGFFALTLAAAPMATAAEGTPTAPLRPLSECLDPQHARGWAVVDGDDIVVDAGRRKFLIHFSANCPDLNWTRLLRFRTAGGGGRVCGHLTEAVLPDDKGGGLSIPCSIASVTSIDAARYRELTTDSPEKDDTARADGNDG